MKSFRLLARAVKSKKREMLVSLQFLLIVALILSFIMYFIEHEAQPDVYTDGMYSFYGHLLNISMTLAVLQKLLPLPSADK